MKKYILQRWLYHIIPLLTTIIIIVSCKQMADQSDNANRKLSNPDQGQTDFEGAMQYEFNMTKDPVSGKIPDGIREMELSQARTILQQQQSNNIIAATTYTFQGPENLGGRTRTLAYDIRFNGAANRIILAGGVSGGVYRSTDDGASWVRTSPIGDLFSVTAIAQDTRAGFRDTW